MVLYAPAHMGASIVKLLQETIGGVFGVITAYFRFNSPLIDELKEGSAHLLALREKTIAAIEAGDSSYLIAKQVVFADRDAIVTNLPFGQDPPPVTFVGSTHCSVCKPNSNFLDPIDILSKAL